MRLVVALAPWQFAAAIVDARGAAAASEAFSSALERLDSVFKEVYLGLREDGTLWVIAENRYDRVHKQLLPFAHDLADLIRRRTGFKLRNILVVYRDEKMLVESKPLRGRHFTVLFFVKNVDSYYFNKDEIRVPHVFKGIDWGRRARGKSGYGALEKRRYSRGGRDPGNVFYEATRDSAGRLLSVESWSEAELLEKLVKVSTRPGDTVGSNISKPSMRRLVTMLGRALVEVGGSKA